MSKLKIRNKFGRRYYIKECDYIQGYARFTKIIVTSKAEKLLKDKIKVVIDHEEGHIKHYPVKFIITAVFLVILWYIILIKAKYLFSNLLFWISFLIFLFVVIIVVTYFDEYLCDEYAFKKGNSVKDFKDVFRIMNKPSKKLKNVLQFFTSLLCKLMHPSYKKRISRLERLTQL